MDKTPVPQLSLLLANYSKEINGRMKRLKFKEVTAAGWSDEMTVITSRYLLAAKMLEAKTESITNTDVQSSEVVYKAWAETMQGIGLVIGTASAYDDDWIYTVRSLGRAAIKSASTFHTRLQAAMDKLLAGGADANFYATFARSIDVELTKAWAEGADAIGVAPDEMTAEDVKQLGNIIDSENNFIAGVIDNVREDQLKEMTPEALVSKYNARVNLWSARYLDTVNRAIAWFGKKTRLIWTLGDTEHCSVCRRLSGTVAFGEEFDQAGVHPQNPPNPVLDKDRGGCGGWNCGCSLKPTKVRRSVNALKKLQAIAAGG